MRRERVGLLMPRRAAASLAEIRFFFSSIVAPKQKAASLTCGAARRQCGLRWEKKPARRLKIRKHDFLRPPCGVLLSWWRDYTTLQPEIKREI